jgi:hypothetical protein
MTLAQGTSPRGQDTHHRAAWSRAQARQRA